MPFAVDDQPLQGAEAGPEGLVVATGVKSTMMLAPLVGELLAELAASGALDPRWARLPLRQA